MFEEVWQVEERSVMGETVSLYMYITSEEFSGVIKE